MTLKTGISGIRGIAGTSLTDGVAVDFIMAFATLIGRGPVVLGRDTRASGPGLEKLVSAALKKMGIDIFPAGISPTPTVQLLVRKLKANGGIIITASHNPSEWNGFKFTNKKGLFLNAKENKGLLDIYGSKRFRKASKPGASRSLPDPHTAHIDEILKNVDADKIRSKKFTVVLDSCNGAGSVITPRFLEALGCRVIPLYTSIGGGFPRGPEPVAENLAELCRKVKEAGADIGFAQDPDADRLSVVTDKGAAIGEEYTIVLAAMNVLSKSGRGSTIVTNLSTSRMIDDIAVKYSAKVLRSKVGEINVVELLLKSGGLIGGEGNGGVIYPKIVPTRDSLTGIALILGLMANEGRKISSIVDGIPKYHMIKTKINCGSMNEAEELMKKTRKLYSKEKIDLTDGVRVGLKDSWLHVRPSNTEPVVRVIAEAKSEDEARKLVDSIITKK